MKVLSMRMREGRERGGVQPINKQHLKYILPLQDTDIINNNRYY